MLAPPASLCAGGPASADPPHGSGGTGVTETWNNPCCQRGRRQNEQTPWMVLTNPLRRWMPSAALSHSGISFSMKQNLACKEPNFLEEYWCLTLERWILILLLRNNGSFCPSCMAFPHNFWIIQNTLGSTFKQTSSVILFFLIFYLFSWPEKKKKNVFSHIQQRIYFAEKRHTEYSLTYF